MSKIQCYLAIIFGSLFLPQYKIGWWKRRLKVIQEEDIKRKWSEINSWFNESDRMKAFDWYMHCRIEEQKEIDNLYRKQI